MDEFRNYLEDLMKELSEILETDYSLEDGVYTFQIKTKDGHFEEVTFYETTDSFDVDKVECTVTIGPIVKNADLLYTFLKNNFELDYGSFAIINEDGIDVLIIIESVIADAIIADDLVAIIKYITEVAHETRELLSKHSWLQIEKSHIVFDYFF